MLGEAGRDEPEDGRKPDLGLAAKGQAGQGAGSQRAAPEPFLRPLEQEERPEREGERVNDGGIVHKDEAAGASREDRKADDQSRQDEALEQGEVSSSAFQHEPADGDGGNPVDEHVPEAGKAEGQARRRKQVRRQRPVHEVEIAVEELAVAQAVCERPCEARVAHRIEPAAAGPQANRRGDEEEQELRDPVASRQLH